MNEVEGEQSRPRSRRRGLLLALAALAVLAGAVVGGVVLDRTVLDDDTTEISEREHDRLISVCMDWDLPRTGCTGWAAGVVDAAELEGVTYRHITRLAGDVLDEWTRYPDDGTELGDEAIARIHEEIDEICADEDVPAKVCLALKGERFD